ncbi:hypothetical protein [Chitiniphilus shinanonensis]|uniref:hypothetical protein n=1 Tax=Chitiniphilus shinanonensis TaxID=553088 RepID=UPI003057A9C7
MATYFLLIENLVLPLIFAALIKLFAKFFKTPMRWLHAIGFAYIAMVSYSLMAAGMVSSGILLPTSLVALVGLSLHLAIAVPFFMILAELRPALTVKIVVFADIGVIIFTTLLLIAWVLLINQL